MSVPEQDSTIAKANKSSGGMKDPWAILGYADRQQLDRLMQARRALIDVTASCKRIELQMKALREEIAELHDQAWHAVKAGRDDQARESLIGWVKLKHLYEKYETRHESLISEQEIRAKAVTNALAMADARADAAAELAASGSLGDVAEIGEFTVRPGELLDHPWMMLQSLIVPLQMLQVKFCSFISGSGTVC
jgi:hypothetical protein